MLREIESAEERHALNIDEDEWVAYLVEQPRREPVRLRPDDLGEQRVDVRRDPNRLIRDPVASGMEARARSQAAYPVRGRRRPARMPPEPLWATHTDRGHRGRRDRQ